MSILKCYPDGASPVDIFGPGPHPALDRSSNSCSILALPSQRDPTRDSHLAIMPFGIIETHGDGPLPGTELLIRKEQTGPVLDGDTSQLKRVMYKVGGVFRRPIVLFSPNANIVDRAPRPS